MKICLLTMEWPPYGCGIGTYMFNLARGLNNLGHQVTVITNDQTPLRCSGVKIIEVPVPSVRRTLLRRVQRWRMEPYHSWSARVYERFVAIHSEEAFDIIETAEFGAWGRHFIGRVDIPLVVRCHNPTSVVWSINQMPSSSWRMPLWLRIQDNRERSQAFYSDAIVSPSHALVNHLSLGWVIPRSRFTVLPNPIDTDLFCPGPFNGAEGKSHEILYVGRLEYNKGVFDLMESVEPLMKKYSELTVRLVGMDIKAPEELSQYGDMASDVIRSLLPRDYHHRVLFTSHVPVSEIVFYQQKALCTVMPTRGFESFSYTALEPMACGSPVIATHCGGPTEIINDGVSGFLVPPGDRVALTEAMEKLIVEKPLRESLSQAARRVVETKYSFRVVVPQIIKVYEKAIQDYQQKLVR